MTITGVADTHVALWYLFGDPRLSIAARSFIETAAEARSKIAVSSIGLVEVVYLVEKGRILPSAYKDLAEALADPEHVFCEVVVSAVVAESMRRVPRVEVPDMPDRIVAATAVYFGVPIISRDGRIRKAGLGTIW